MTDIYRYIGESIFQKEDKDNFNIQLVKYKIGDDCLGVVCVYYTYHMKDDDHTFVWPSVPYQDCGVVESIGNAFITNHMESKGLKEVKIEVGVEIEALEMFKKYFKDPFKVTQEELTLFEIDFPVVSYGHLKIKG